jgi:hypothetical protein
MRLARDWIRPLLDTWPPTVRLTAPAPGATVTGPITLAAAAAEMAGVAGVQFLADGAPAGAEDTAAPYEITIDTTRLPNGRHAISARARTTSGQTATSEAVTVTVDNPPPAPGQLTLVGISITPPAPAVGDTVTASFTVRNTGGQPVPVDSLQVAARESGGAVAPFPVQASPPVLPQQEGTYQQTRSFLGAAPGAYTARPEAFQDGQPVEIRPGDDGGVTVQFTVAPCAFVLGFQLLREVVPSFMGQPPFGACLENEQHHPASGEASQRTTAWHGRGGLLVWRRLDNWTGFTDGHRTWTIGPYGLELRLNTERFCWEPDAAPGRCLPSGGRPSDR